MKFVIEIPDPPEDIDYQHVDAVVEVTWTDAISFGVSTYEVTDLEPVVDV